MRFAESGSMVEAGHVDETNRGRIVRWFDEDMAREQIWRSQTSLVHRADLAGHGIKDASTQSAVSAGAKKCVQGRATGGGFRKDVRKLFPEWTADFSEGNEPGDAEAGRLQFSGIFPFLA